MALPSYNDALARALSVVHALEDHEVVELVDSVGRILAQAIVADRHLPPYNRSQMDGYAVVASEITNGVTMEVTARVSAGTNEAVELKPNTCVAIATGAPVPEQFDAVVQHELTDRGDLAGGKVTFIVDEVKIGQAIHRRGSDATQGKELICAGLKLSAQHIGIAATVGEIKVSVIRKPRVIVLTSGDEVVSPNVYPEPHQIRNGNGPMLASLFETFGCEIIHHQHVKDDPESTTQAVNKALQISDLLVTVGGISAGERDFFPEAFGSEDIAFVVQGAAIQPGKPVMVGKKADTMVLGLPGNPVSSLACAYLFGLPIVRALLGVNTQMQWVELPLARSVVPNRNRTGFRPCYLVDGKIEIPSWQGSGDLSHTSQTVGLAQLPMNDDEISAGELVSFLRFE